LEAVTRSLAIEYVNHGIRVNAVAPGIVDTPMHKDDPREFLKTLQPMGQISAISDIVNAVLYLTDAGQVTGEVLRVDGGSHVGKW
jgi:NAD(P)-dependent dehydrogenase (short-subunit alcohol dehydrogenase family)